MVSKNIKSILVWFLTILVVVSMSSQAVRADTNDGNSTAVASIGDTDYDTLQAAVDAARAGDTVRLLTDLDEHIDVDKAITLDLNGKTLSDSTASDDLIEVTGGNTHLTVVNGTIFSTSGLCNAIYVTDGASLTLGEGAVVNAEEATAVHAYTIGDSYPISRVTINGGEVVSSGEYALHIGGRAALEMSSGSVMNQSGNTTGGAMLLHGRDAAISGGTVGSTGSGSTVVFGSNDGALTVSGDTTTISNKGTGVALTSGVSYGGQDYPGAVTVDAGIIEAPNGGKSVAVSGVSGSTFTINGGYYSDNVGNGDEFTRPEGKNLYKSTTKTGYYELREDPRLMIDRGDEGVFYFDTLAAALVEADDRGDIITVLSDYEEPSGPLTIDKPFSIVLNGHTITKPGTITVTDFAGFTDSEFDDGLGGAIVFTEGGSLVVSESTSSTSLIQGLVVMGVTVSAQGDAIVADDGGLVNIIDAAVTSENGVAVKAKDGGTVQIYDGAVITSTNGRSVEVAQGGTFEIDEFSADDQALGKVAAAFSDDAGNADGFTRPPGQMLVKGSDGMYRLAVAVAGIGDAYYGDLNEAIRAAKNGDTVRLVADIESDHVFSVNYKNVTLDLNGHTLKKNGGGEVIEVYGGTGAALTLDDSAGGGKIEGSNAIIVYPGGGKLTVKAGTIETTSDAIVLTHNASAIIEGGEISGTGNDSSAVYLEGNNSSLEVSGGTLSSTTPTGATILSRGASAQVSISGGDISADTSRNGRGVEIADGGTLTISGATVTAATAVEVHDHATATIGGNTQLNGNKLYGVYAYDNARVALNADVEVNGAAAGIAADGAGTITVNDGAVITGVSGVDAIDTKTDGRVTINGGLFSDDRGSTEPRVTISDNKMLIPADDPDYPGYFTPALRVAKNTRTGEIYPSLAAAVAAAQDHDTIRMFKNSTEGEDPLVIDKRIIIDLDGHTISKNDDIKITSAVIFKDSGADKTGLVATGLTVDEGGNLGIEEGATVRNANGPAVSFSGPGALNLIDGTLEGATGGIYANRDDARVYVHGGTATGASYGIDQAGAEVEITGGVISGGTASINATDPAKFKINGGVYSDDTGNSAGYVRKGDKPLVPGANTEYPDMYALSTEVARINRGDEVLYYATLAEAVADAQPGETVIMVDDHEVSGTVNISKNLTLDLNDNTVSGNFNGPIINLPFNFDPHWKEVTITDTSAGANGLIRNKNTGAGSSAVQVEAYGRLNMEGGNLEGQVGIKETSTRDYTKVKVTGGSVAGNAYGIQASGETIVEGGNIRGYYDGITMDVHNPEPKTIVSGGTISGSTLHQDYCGIRLNAGELEVTGGSISGGTGIRIITHTSGSDTYAPSAKVSGGQISGAMRSVDSSNNTGPVDPAKFEITGGKYSDDIGNNGNYKLPDNTALLDEDGDGWYELTEYVASITRGNETITYTTLQAAFDAAESGDTVEVISDIALTEKAQLRGKTITLDIGSHTITNDASFDTSRFFDGLIFLGADSAGTGLTITGNGDGKLVSTNGHAIFVDAAQSPRDGSIALTVDKVTIEALDESIYATGRYATINVDSGTLHSRQSGTPGTYRGTITGATTTINVNGGTIINDSGAAITHSSGAGTVTINDGVIQAGGKTFDVQQVSRVHINGGAFSDDIGNGGGYNRDDDKNLIKGADPRYPEMYALGDAVATIERDGKTLYYTSLASAVADAKAGETVFMVADHVVSETVNITKNITLDLNGNTVSGDFNGSIINLPFNLDARWKEVTITDTSDAGNGMISNSNRGSGSSAVQVEAYGRLNMEGGNLEGYVGIKETSGNLYTKVKVTGGTVKGSAYGIDATGETNVEGGEIQGGYDGIYMRMYGPEPKTKVSGGSISSSTAHQDYCGIRLVAGEVEVTGGSISGGTGIKINTHTFGSSTYAPSAKVSGGEISGAMRSIDSTNETGPVDPTKFTITGGKFSDDIGNGDGYKRPEDMILLDEDGDGWYELSVPVAKIGDVCYTTLQAAFDAAKTGDTVEVISDITLTEKARLEGKTITLDIGSHTITNDESFDTSGYFSGLIYLGADPAGTGLTITGNEDGKLVSTNGNAIFVDAAVHPRDGSIALTVDTVTIEALDESIYATGRYATINVNSGTLHSKQSGTQGTYRGTITGATTTINVNGGTIINDTGTAITHSSGAGTVTINGGVIEAGDKTFDVQQASRVHINGGAFSDDIGNGEGYVRSDGKRLIIGADPDHPDMYALGDAVATIERDGKTLYYTSLASAVADAKAGETVVMVADEELTGQVAIKKDLTLDLNGKQISANFDGSAIAFPFGSDPTQKTLTITDTSDAGDGSIRNTNSSGSAVDVEAMRTLNLEGGNLYGVKTGLSLSSAYGTANIKDGTIEGGIDGITIDGGELTVEGGEVYGRSNGILGGLGSPAPKIKISGGEISSSVNSGDYSGIYLRGGDLEVTGGIISGGTGISIRTFTWGSSTQESSAKVSGGVVKGAVQSIKSTDDSGTVDPAKFTITGGAFSDNIGNKADYTRSDNKELRKGDDNLYRLEDVDKTALEQAIEAATADKDATPVSADGRDVADGTEYVEDRETKDALEDAIAAAQDVMNDTQALQSEVDEATAALEAAKQAFDDAKKTASVNKEELEKAITDAKAAEEPNTTSEDGKDLTPGTTYTTPAEKKALDDAIEEAQRVFDDKEATQNEVDAATNAVKKATEAYKANVKTAAVDKKALEQAIDEATDDKEATPVSADGKDMKPGTEYVDQATQDALTAAIAKAQAVADKEDATQNEVDEARTELEKAKKAFDDAKKTATVDKKALNSAIASATEDKDATPVSADGKDQKPGTEYVDQATQDALNDAIAAAQAVADKEDATQNEVDEARTELEKAKRAFDDAKKTASVDKKALNDAITSATKDKNDTPVSADGKDLADGTEYVDQATQDALTTAITKAQEVFDNPDATQSEVDAATTAMKAALQTFDDAKKTAQNDKITEVDKEALEQAINEATKDKEATPVSEDGKDLTDGTKYVDKATQDALTTAIAKAQEVLANPAATQSEVDKATSDMKAALQAFDDAKKTAQNDEIAKVDKTALKQAIDEASKDKEATPVSEDGKDLENGTKYVDKATQDALTSAIAKAQEVFDNPDATQSEVDAATTAMKASLQAFDDAKKTAQNDKVTEVDKTALEQAIDEATKDKEATPVSEDGKDLADGTKYVDQATENDLTAAIAKAQEVFDNPDATQSEVDAATDAIKAALQIFEDAKKTAQNDEIAKVDKTALEQAIDEASKDKEATPVSEDGKDLENGTKYVDKATQDALTAAIAKAQEVLDNPDATQSDVDKATSDMKAALQTFDKAKKTAQNDEITKVDKTALEQAIDEASKDKEATPVSEDGKDLENGTKYVDKATQDALTSAIAKAQEVLANPDATQSDVDKATSDMKDALQAFDKAKKTAQNDEITKVDKTALGNAITAATEDMNGTPVSADGKDQPEVTLYVNQAAQAALTKAIEEAKKVFDNPNATQSEVNAATEALTAAQNTFDKTKKNGLKHDFGEWVQTKAPTCTEPGEEIRVCSYDATHTETREIKALGHDFGEWTETKAPTCTEAGEETRVCKHDATHIETRKIAALGHDWDEGIITPAPECTEEGVITYTCRHDSSHTRTEAISKAGHTWHGEKTVDIEPTCETEGEKSLHCEVCGAIDPESIEKIPPLGHDWSEWTVTKEATETEEGEESRICSRCGEIETRPVPKLEPKPDEPVEPVEPVDPIEPIDPTEPTEPEDPDEPVEPTDPDEPVEPTDPDEPVEPTDPDEPVEPTDPDEPVEPTDPDEPVEPTDPDEPVEPVDPVEPTDPDEPVDPTDPDKPVNPTDPDEPVEPADPDEPVEPTDPDEPVEPTDPDEPVEPVDPVEPTDPDKPVEPVDPVNPTDPDEPVEPTDPDEPVEPTDPDEPVEPTDPDEPVEPTDPDEPVEPTDPDEPVNPTDPDEPVDPTDPENPDEPVDPTNPDEPDNNEDTDTEKEADNTEKEPEKEPEDKATDIDNKSDTRKEAGNKANVTPASTQKATNQKDTSIVTAGTTKGKATPTTGDNGFIPVYIMTAAGAALAALLAGIGMKRRKNR